MFIGAATDFLLEVPDILFKGQKVVLVRCADRFELALEDSEPAGFTVLVGNLRALVRGDERLCVWMGRLTGWP